MRSKYALRNGLLSITIFVINGIMAIIIQKETKTLFGLEFYGFIGIITDFLSFLNLSDMGISGSVGASLYEPISQDNYPKIKGILLFLKNAYKICGLVFSIGTACISVGMLFLFTVISKNSAVSNTEAAAYFLLSATNIGLSFLFSYRLIVISTDQRLFALKIVNSGIKIIATIFKLIALIETHSYALFLILDIVFTLIYFAVMNALIKKYYAKVEKAKPVLEPKDKRAIFRNIKGLVFHQIGGYALNGTNSLYTGLFSGLAVTGQLLCYQTIITMMYGVVVNFAIGITASIGNLIATTNAKKRYQTFRTIFMVVCLCVIAAAITFINSVQAFISAFFGADAVISISVVYLLAFSFFLSAIRPVTEQFKSAAGIFYEDRFVPLVEAAVNIIACVTFGMKFGVVGVVAGNAFSTLAIVSWQKPYMTFKYVFHKRLRFYFIDLAQYVAVGIVCLLITFRLCLLVTATNPWAQFFEKVFITLPICIIIPLAVFFKTSRFVSLWDYAKSIRKKPAEE